LDIRNGRQRPDRGQQIAVEHFLSKNAEVRRRVEEKFAEATQYDQDVMADQRETRQAELDKLLRLRALRLAKEAADKGVHEQAQPETPALAQKAKPVRRAKRS
jgi:hypothetical protein